MKIWMLRPSPTEVHVGGYLASGIPFRFGKPETVFQSFIPEKIKKTEHKEVLSSVTNTFPTALIG